MRIGEVLKDWRLMEKMTLKEAAPLIGISLATLARIEKGDGMDGVTMWAILAFLFGEERETDLT